MRALMARKPSELHGSTLLRLCQDKDGAARSSLSLPSFLRIGIRVLLVPSALVGRWTVQFTLWSSDRVNDNPTPLAATNGERGSHQVLGRLYLQLILQRMPSLMAED